MNQIEYKFENLMINMKSNYIFQRIKDRKLTDVYHSHDFYEWIFVIKGNCTHILNEEEVCLNENVLLLLSPGDRHKFTDQSHDAHVISLSVKKDEFENFKSAFNIYEETSYIQTILNPNQVRIILNFYHSAVELEYKLLLANLLKIYIDSFNNTDSPPGMLKSAMIEMRKPENLKIGIKRFTEITNLSKTHLNRLLKKHYNTTMHDYIVKTRLEIAYNLLIITNTNMEDISESLGYASFSHFNKIFKIKYGISPAELRKKYGSWTT